MSSAILCLAFAFIIRLVGSKSVSVFIHHDEVIEIGEGTYDLPELIDVDILRYENPDNFFDVTDYDYIDVDPDSDEMFRHVDSVEKVSDDSASLEETMKKLKAKPSDNFQDIESSLRELKRLQDDNRKTDHIVGERNDSSDFEVNENLEEYLREELEDEYEDQRRLAEEMFNNSILWHSLGELLLGLDSRVSPADNREDYMQYANDWREIDALSRSKPNRIAGIERDLPRIKSRKYSNKANAVGHKKHRLLMNQLKKDLDREYVAAATTVQSRKIDRDLIDTNLRKRRQVGWDVNKISGDAWNKTWTRPPSLKDRRKEYYKRVLVIKEEDLKAARAKQLQKIVIYIGSTLSAVLVFLVFVYFLIRYPDYFICGCCVSRCIISILCPTFGRFLESPEKFIQERMHEYIPGMIVHADGTVEHYPPSEEEIEALKAVIELMMD